MATRSPAAFQAFQLEDAIALARAKADGYAPELLRSDRLSVGLYRLAVGARDDQTPHLEDEVYYAVRGRARIEVGGQVHPVQPGSIIFIAANAPHRFVNIEEELILLVFWAPPEGMGESTP